METYPEDISMPSNEELDQEAIQDSCDMVLDYLEDQMLLAILGNDSMRINDLMDMIDAVTDLGKRANASGMEDEHSLDF